MDTKDILDEPRMSEKQLLRRLRRTKSLRERQSVKVNTKETEIDKIDPRGLFTREQLLEFEIAFDEYDTFSTGFIYSHQLVSLMRNLGLNPTSKELEAFIMKYAVEGQTKIYLDEFFLIVYDKLSQVDATQEAFEMFQVFDHNENNCIPIEEMRQVLEYIQANGFFAKVVRGTEIDECLEGLGFNESNKELDVLDFMALMLPAEKVIAYDDKRKLGKSIRRDREKKEKELREIDEDKKINKKDRNKSK